MHQAIRWRVESRISFHQVMLQRVNLAVDRIRAASTFATQAP